MSNADNEIKVISAVHAALEPLDDEARTRVLTYISSRLGVGTRAVTSRPGLVEIDNGEQTGKADTDEAMKQPSGFSSFAELFAAADPKSGGEKALVAGYWLQICEGAESFTGAAAHRELKDLGHKLANITKSIDSMKSRKPMLILQIRKGGSSGQARKLYRVSQEGIKRVEEMVGG